MNITVEKLKWFNWNKNQNIFWKFQNTRLHIHDSGKNIFCLQSLYDCSQDFRLSRSFTVACKVLLWWYITPFSFNAFMLIDTHWCLRSFHDGDISECGTMLADDGLECGEGVPIDW